MDELAVKEYLAQGAMLAGAGKHEEAIAFFDKAEREKPMEIEAYISKGIAYANLEDYEEAKSQFEKALKVNRMSGVAYYHLGNISVMQGDAALGFEHYNRAVANGYDDAQLFYSLGLLHEENGELDLAMRQYSKAISKDAMRPDIRIRKAYLLKETGRILEALRALDETIVTNPDIFEGYHLKFMILVEMQQFDLAEELLDRAEALFPKDPGLTLNRATLHIEMQEFDEALALLETLENAEGTDDPMRRRILLDRAQIYAAKGNVMSAISELEKARALSDKYEGFDTEVMYLLCNSYLATEDYSKVLDYARQMLENAEDGYQKESARYYVPFSLKMQGRMDEALPLYLEAINEYRNQSLSSPGNLDACLFRVMCLRDIDQAEKALELIDYVITLQPEMGETRLLRAAILETLGRACEAEEEAKKANTLLPADMRGDVRS